MAIMSSLSAILKQSFQIFSDVTELAHDLFSVWEAPQASVCVNGCSKIPSLKSRQLISAMYHLHLLKTEQNNMINI